MMLRFCRRRLVKVVFAVVLIYIFTIVYTAVQSHIGSLGKDEDVVVHEVNLRDAPNGRVNADHPPLGVNDENALLAKIAVEQQSLLDRLRNSFKQVTLRWAPPQMDDVDLRREGGSQVQRLIEKGLIIPKWNLPSGEKERQDKNASFMWGEYGSAITIKKESLSQVERREYDAGWQANAFNEFASERMSLHRTLPDTRDAECRVIKYPKDLPDTSVIIIFHNEAWKALLRTIHSVLDRSPPHLIKEIILVDDFSTHDHLKVRLEEYVAVLGKVRVVRAKRREGLIRARLLGASLATGDVLTYLDSHCECTLGWLEPLLARIALNRTIVVTPVIDVINDQTLQYQFGPAKATNVGGFDWNLQFRWHAIPEHEMKRRKSDVEPVRSPTMAGGLFAISREYFEHIGAYDPGMDIWGGENLEMSFRIWMCGGSLEIVVCSHVGHIFRSRSPYSWAGGNALRKNSLRLAVVWMDEFSKYYYERSGSDAGNYGDVSARKKLREDLKCKSFSWYLENIYPELFIPGESLAGGEIRSKALNSKQRAVCFDAPVDRASSNPPVNPLACQNAHPNQKWYLTKEGEIRREEGCIDYAGKDVIIFQCHGMGGNQKWIYGPDNTVRHHYSNLCVELSAEGDSLRMKPCVGTDQQIWHWSRHTPDSVKRKEQLKYD